MMKISSNFVLYFCHNLMPNQYTGSTKTQMDKQDTDINRIKNLNRLLINKSVSVLRDYHTKQALF